MKKFDLMKNKPNLDVDTLNFIWDTLWRYNACNERKNIEQRIRCSEREDIMDYLERLAE